MRRGGIDPGTVCLEVSERHETGLAEDTQALLGAVRRDHRMKIALDDFGRGFAGLHLLYNLEPDFLKIDRFFISSIAADRKRRIFVANIVNMAHLLGITVIAEGVETELEYAVCREVGCDLIQGFLVAVPTTDVGGLQERYSEIGILAGRERRRRSRDLHMIKERIERTEPVTLDSNIFDVFHRFRADTHSSFIPVVDSLGQPVGIVREQDMKELVYSPYGRDILSNRNYSRGLQDFVTRCPVADIQLNAQGLIEIFNKHRDQDAILVVEDMRYAGFLSARSLLSIVSEQNLTTAREQNPISQLPGNRLIYEFVSQALSGDGAGHHFVYIDFDNFKPFNDHFGFRVGDRVIATMAELLRLLPAHEDRFIGHVGGDDFFIGWRGSSLAAVQEETAQLLYSFAREVRSFYDLKAQHDGYIIEVDRQGQLRRFPLLSASAVIMEVGPGPSCLTVEAAGEMIARGKRQAKIAQGGIHIVHARESARQFTLEGLTPLRLSGGR